MDKRDALIHRLESDVVGGVDATQSFRDKLRDDPMHALEWADGTYKKVARGHVARIILCLVSRDDELTDEGLKDLSDRVCSDALRNTEGLGHSTSQCSNLLDAATNAAWAHWAIRIEELIRFGS